MRNLLLILISLFISIECNSQSCLPGGIHFYTQALIDNFQANYPGCTKIEGVVVIDDWYDHAITNLNGLNVVTSIGGDLSINENYGLLSLTGLSSLKSISGNLCICDDRSLTDLSGLENLKNVGGSVTIFYNETLTNLTGLDSLNSIGGFLLIQQNFNLINLEGLHNLSSIGGELRIWLNYDLTSLSGLDNINPGSIFDLFIVGNFSLATCEVESICDYLSSPNGTIDIYQNEQGCNSQSEVELACEVGLKDNIDIECPVKIYPNPTSTQIIIELSTISKEINFTVFDINGENLFNDQINAPLTKIDITNLSQGIYYIKITSQGAIHVYKMVKE